MWPTRWTIAEGSCRNTGYALSEINFGVKMKIALSKLIREVKVIDIGNGEEHLFIRPGLRLVGVKKIYIEGDDFDDVASQLVGQGFKYVDSQEANG